MKKILNLCFALWRFFHSVVRLEADYLDFVLACRWDILRSFSMVVTDERWACVADILCLECISR